MIRIFASDPPRLLPRQVLDSLIRLEVILHPEVLAPIVIPFIGVATVAIHIAIGGRRASVGKENRDLMD